MSDDTIKNHQADDYELDEEYDLSKLPIMPKGRYVPERRIGSNLILLDPDLAKAFPSDSAVNKALKLVLKVTQILEKKRKS